MKHFNSPAQSKWGLAWSVLALIAMGYTGQAQEQNASTVTLTGSVKLTTCFVKIATGSGAAGGGTGNTAHTFTIPTVQNNVTTTSATRGGALGAVTKFTVGLASSSGAVQQLGESRPKSGGKIGRALGGPKPSKQAVVGP